ncbi:LpqB family beta-propeller domain-containing protein, partial [Janibacter sp. GXQ6167]|uniref:LpqB family beta-propeller domain-containing protein n=1 Tax=Janibacter sp. GXQ6167 TaxID=3240791 RepID=UPI0035235EF9
PAAGLSEDVTVRTNLAAQFVATLMQLPGVADVELSVEGQLIQLPNVEPPLTSPEQLGFVERTIARDAKAVVWDRAQAVPVAAGRLLSLTEDELSDASSPFPPIGRDWRQIALSADGAEVTGVDTSGTELMRWRDDGSSVRVPYFADRLVRPRYDGNGVIWVGGRGSGATESIRVWAINATVDPSDPRSRPAHIPIGWLAGRRVRALDVSPDGSRIAVLSSASGGARLDVAGITRQANGLPTGTSGQPLRVATRLVDLVDIVWTTAHQIAVIARRAANEPRGAFLCDVGGEITALPRVPDAQSVTTTAGPQELVVGSGNGHVYQRSGQRFVRLTLPKGATVAVAGR